MHVLLPNKERLPVEHEHRRQLADVMTQGARVVLFLRMRACWNQNAELHMHKF